MPTVAATTAFAPADKCLGKTSFAPQPKSPRQIAREEIQRQKQLDKLQEKYESGQISRFEYNVAKAVINLPQILDVEPKFATTA